MNEQNNIRKNAHFILSGKNKMIAEIFLIIVSILLIAASAIGIDCYEKNKSFWEDDSTRKNSRIFLIVAIVVAFLSMVLGGGLMVMGR